MSDRHPLTDVVQLYRWVDRPGLQDNAFSGELRFASARDVLRRLKDQDSKDGQFSEIKVDENLILESESLPDSGDKVTFTFRLAIQGSARFFTDFTALSEDRRLGRGQLPDHFYLVTEDYLHGIGEEPPESVKNLKTLAEFIQSLKALSDHHYETSGSGAWTLLFLTNDEHAVLETKIANQIATRCPSIAAKELLDDLLSNQESLHQREKRLMFNATMCEVLKGGLTFGQFIDRTEDLTRIYYNNLKTYLSGFSFEKARRDVAEAQAEFAERLSKVVNDMTMKLLGLPISLFAISAVSRQISDSGWEQFLLVIIAALASFVLHEMVYHQKIQLQRITASKNLVFNSLAERSHDNNYPTDLENAIKDAVSSLDDDAETLRRTLIRYAYFVWSPVVLSLILIAVVSFSQPQTTESNSTSPASPHARIPP